MRILNKEQFLREPNGTVFATYIPDMLDDNIRIKTGYYESDGKPTFNGVAYLCPDIDHSMFPYDGVPSSATRYYSDCSTIDTSACDFDEDTLFAVFSNNEVRKMISLLTWALCKGEAHLDTDDDGTECY